MPFPKLEVRHVRRLDPGTQIIDSDRLVSVAFSDGYLRLDGGVAIFPRIGGQFADHAILLDSTHDWVIGIDDQDFTILVPLKPA